MAKADLLDRVKQEMRNRAKTLDREIDARTKTVEREAETLETSLDEYERLTDALASMDGSSIPSGLLAPAIEGPIVRHKRGRKKGSGKRREELITLLKKHKDGLTANEIGTELGAKPNYFYRILNALADEKIVVKEGKKWKLVIA